MTPQNQHAEQFEDIVNTDMDLKTVIDNLPIAIFVVDKERRILLSNRMANENHGCDHRNSDFTRLGDVVGCANADDNEEGCGFSPLCVLCKVKASIDNAFATQKSIPEFETDITIPSQGVRCLRLTITYIHQYTPLQLEQEVCIITIKDISDLKKKEHLVAASETIGAICHGMSQPLQAILGNIELLGRCQLDDSAILRVEKIVNEIERIKSFTYKLLHLTDYRTKRYLSTQILDVEESTK
jgi:nitrogen-specific signal transduction histidine kinase